jgi:E3 ubiquitin-protein ligase SHPRH
MSTAGGAAGLTLTVASTAFLLEPSLNPALEAQAAARIYRLGQARPTRVVRLLAEGTVERCILEIQRRKLENGEAAPDGEAGAAAGALAEVDAGMLLSVYEQVK